MEPGAQLADYELIEKIASGGMAEVYLARSFVPTENDLVVVKRLHPHLVAQREWVEMLFDEASMGRRLHHRDIAAVHRVVDCDGVLFLVMEYVDGKDLRHVFKEVRRRNWRTMPFRHAASIGAAAARALHYVHELGIVHRDVSMSNIMIGYDGRAKLIDFGIAKADHRITDTESGVLKGKPRFMSPEQVVSGEVDRRSDVFSLAVVLYEITTGTVLFRGNGPIETMREVVRGTIEPPSARCPGYPDRLEAILMRALQRNPDKRYDDAAQLAGVLEALCAHEWPRAEQTGLAAYMEELFPRAKVRPWSWCPGTNEVSAFLDSAFGA